MADQAGSAPTKGTVVPYLQLEGAMKAAEFYKKAFGAEIAMAHPVDDKGRTMHVHLYVNDGSLMISDFYPEYGHAPEKPAGFNVALIVASSGKKLAIFEPSRNRLTRAAATADTLNQFIQIPMAPADAVTLLLGIAPNSAALATRPPDAIVSEGAVRSR